MGAENIRKYMTAGYAAITESRHCLGTDDPSALEYSSGRLRRIISSVPRILINLNGIHFEDIAIKETCKMMLIFSSNIVII
jgi:hypothetical protein